VKAAVALLGVLSMVGGCGPSGPLYTPVSTIPPGQGLVYIYEDAGNAPVTIDRNNKELASLRAGEYLFHFADPGRNVYSIQSSFAQRGGVFGAMGIIDSGSIQPTVLTVDTGKTYYLKVIGAGWNIALWRVDQATGSQELPSHHRVDTR
jgi:predicted small lipoprotein YifL